MADAKNEKPDLETDSGSEYDPASFWTKVAAFARKAGIEVVEKALTLYYCVQDRDTPAWAKGSL